MSTSNRPARVIAAGLAASLLFMTVIGSVAAKTSQQVEIVSHMNFNPDGPNFGDFSASGPAVDSGLVCASGSVVDTAIVFGGFQSGRSAQILVRKTFTCEGGGTFFVKIQVHLDFETSTETFTWVVMGGTGAYANLRGSGSGTTVSDGSSDPQTGNFNTYTGGLH